MSVFYCFLLYIVVYYYIEIESKGQWQMGKLIAIDGLDASGKKTQTELLMARFEKSGVPHKYVSYPTYDPSWSAQVNMYLSGAFGSDPESVNPYAASAFFATDRYCSYMLDWKKDYDSGSVILANRYASANAVHQLSKLDELQYEGFLEWIDDYEYKKLAIPRPDAVVYLCLPPHLSQRLLEKRCDETGAVKDIHESNRAHLENSYRAALYSAKKLGWIQVNCNNGEEIRSVEDIHGEIVERLKRAIPDIGL